MRTLLFAILAAAVLGTGAGCAHRTPTSSGGGSRQDFVVYVFNNSAKQTVPVTIYVDGVCVEDRSYAPYSRTSTQVHGEIRLRLPTGVHQVRARVANLTEQTDVDLDHFMCTVHYYDETTDPKERPTRVPKLIVEQIGRC